MKSYNSIYSNNIDAIYSNKCNYTILFIVTTLMLFIVTNEIKQFYL